MTCSKAVSSFSIKGCFTISIFTQLTHSLVLLSQRHSYYTFWFHLSDTKSLSNTPRTDWLDQALCPGVWWWCLLTVMTTEHCTADLCRPVLQEQWKCEKLLHHCNIGSTGSDYAKGGQIKISRHVLWPKWQMNEQFYETTFNSNIGSCLVQSSCHK